LEAGVDIVYLNSFGTPVGRIFSSSPKGMAELRKAQVVSSSSPKTLELFGTLVAAKEFIGYRMTAREDPNRRSLSSLA
jgi:CRISPR/Cas system-associated endonuclease Cas1